MTYPINPVGSQYAPFVGYIGGPTGRSFAITNGVRTAPGVVTLTIGSGHGILAGDRAVAAGLTSTLAPINGTHRVTAVAATTISFQLGSGAITSTSTGTAGSTVLAGPIPVVNDLANVYISNDGPAYRHYKDAARTEFWDELLYSSDTEVDPTAPLGGTGAQYPV